MKLSLRNEIYDQLSSYLAGQIELSELHNWLIPASWDIDSEPVPVKKLVHRLQLLFAEFSNGDRDEEELRANFWNLLNRSSVTVIVGIVSPSVESTSSTTRVGMVGAVLPAGRLYARELV
jgi:hypothetical protein